VDSLDTDSTTAAGAAGTARRTTGEEVDGATAGVMMGCPTCAGARKDDWPTRSVSSGCSAAGLVMMGCSADVCTCMAGCCSGKEDALAAPVAGPGTASGQVGAAAAAGVFSAAGAGFTVPTVLLVSGAKVVGCGAVCIRNGAG
jgi:hypothetical protein